MLLKKPYLFIRKILFQFILLLISRSNFFVSVTGLYFLAASCLSFISSKKFIVTPINKHYYITLCVSGMVEMWRKFFDSREQAGFYEQDLVLSMVDDIN